GAGMLALSTAMNLTSSFHIDLLRAGMFLTLKEIMNRIPAQLTERLRQGFWIGLFISLMMPSISFVGHIIKAPYSIILDIRISNWLGELFSSIHRTITNFITNKVSLGISSIINFCLRKADNCGGTPLHVA